MKLGLANGIKLVRNVTIAARGVTKVDFSNTVNIGDEGPGGGIIFFVRSDNWYMECSREDLGRVNWDQAITIARNYRGGRFTDWRLPDKEELGLMYRNLKVQGLGGFGNAGYWSSSHYTTSHWWAQWFSDGRQDFTDKNSTESVRAVRSFTL